MNDARMKRLQLVLGTAIDNFCRTEPTTTVEITAALCRLAASAGAICNREDPGEGIGFAVETFMEQIAIQAKAHGIEGVFIEKIPAGPEH